MTISWRAAVLMAVSAVLVIPLPSPATVWVWGVFVTACCLLDLLAAPSPRRLRLSRAVDPKVRAGEATTCSLTLEADRGMRLDVRDAWPPSASPTPGHARVRLRPGRPHTLVTRLVPRRRGVLRADRVTVRSWGPLGLAARQVSIDAPVHVTVLPPFLSRRLLPSRLARLAEMTGATHAVVRGPGTEFDSLRDYVRGDDPRDIDWRASARSRDLVVRTWRPERDRHVMVVVDSGRAAAMLLGAPAAHRDGLDLGRAPRLDAHIEAAFLLSALVDRAGDRVHLRVVDREVRARIDGARGALLLRRFAHRLVDVSASTAPVDWSRVEAEVRAALPHRGTVVVLTEVPPVGSDPIMREALARLARRHTVLVGGSVDPALAELARPVDRSSAAEAFTRAAAIRARDEVEEGAEDLAALGVHVVTADAGLLAARVADAWIDLKRRALA